MLEGALGVPGLFLPTSGCGPSPAPCCPAPHEWGHPLPARAPGAAPVPPHGARAPAAPRWVAAAGAAGSGCVTLCLLGREQMTVEKPWLCLASRCLRSAAACPHPCSAPGTGAAGRTGGRDVAAACPSQTQEQCCRDKASCSPPPGSRAAAPSKAPQPQRLSVSLFPTIRSRCAAGDPPWGYPAGPWPDGRIPVCSFSCVTSGVTRRLGLGLPCSPGH